MIISLTTHIETNTNKNMMSTQDHSVTRIATLVDFNIVLNTKRKRQIFLIQFYQICHTKPPMMKTLFHY